MLWFTRAEMIELARREGPRIAALPVEKLQVMYWQYSAALVAQARLRAVLRIAGRKIGAPLAVFERRGRR